jgi:GDP-mannose 6-dehydrogenase
MVPGTSEKVLIPLLEAASGRRVGVHFGVCVNPEFLREGSSMADFLDPPKTVVGQSDDRSGSAVMAVYDSLPGARFQTPIATAEMIKFVDNGYHALKVAFANEIGSFCAAFDVDAQAVMDIFLTDTKLNISDAYLRSGFAFGGSCLPKDLRALVHAAHGRNLDVPLLSNVLPSNEAHLRRFVDDIVSTGRSRVGIFGLSFKPGTDDLRESPMVELAKQLITKGLDVRIHDAGIAISRLLGSNRDYIGEHLPQLDQLLATSVEEVLSHAEVCVLGTADDYVVEAVRRATDRVVVDLVSTPGRAALS